MNPLPHIISIAAIVGILFGYQYVSQPPVQAAQEAPQAMVAAIPSTDRERWAVDFLAALGNTSPTADTVAFVVEWTLAEDSGDGAMVRNNPLNTTLSGHNAIGAINTDGDGGVKHYATYQDGMQATIDTIMQGNFIDIAAALQANNPSAAKAALFAAPWAESRYNYGAGWPQYTIGVR